MPGSVCGRANFFGRKKSERVSFGANFFYLRLKGKEVLHSVGLVTRVAKKCRRVERSHNKATVLFNEIAMLFRHLKIRVDEANGSYSAKANNDFRVDKLNLGAEPFAAGGNLFFLGVAVLRRAAFDHICNINIAFAGKVNNLKHFIKQYSAAADERFAAQILVFAGAFADEQHVGVGASHAENNVSAGGAKLALLAVKTFGAEFFQIHYCYLRDFYTNII